jgi:hypothetical protein
MPSTPIKPIAILCEDRITGFQHLMQLIKGRVSKFDHRSFTATDTNEQDYIVAERPEQLYGYQISDYRITPGFGGKDLELAKLLVKTAKERMR